MTETKPKVYAPLRGEGPEPTLEEKVPIGIDPCLRQATRKRGLKPRAPVEVLLDGLIVPRRSKWITKTTEWYKAIKLLKEAKGLFASTMRDVKKYLYHFEREYGFKTWVQFPKGRKPSVLQRPWYLWYQVLRRHTKYDITRLKVLMRVPYKKRIFCYEVPISFLIANCSHPASRRGPSEEGASLDSNESSEALDPRPKQEKGIKYLLSLLKGKRV
jgi:hypothetical protein